MWLCLVRHFFLYKGPTFAESPIWYSTEYKEAEQICFCCIMWSCMHLIICKKEIEQNNFWCFTLWADSYKCAIRTVQLMLYMYCRSFWIAASSRTVPSQHSMHFAQVTVCAYRCVLWTRQLGAVHSCLHRDHHKAILSPICECPSFIQPLRLKKKYKQ